MSNNTARLTQNSSDIGVVRRLFGYLRGETTLLLGVLIVLVLASTAQALAPALIGRAIDQFISSGDRSGLTQTMLLLLVTYGKGHYGRQDHPNGVEPIHLFLALEILREWLFWEDSIEGLPFRPGSCRRF